jgi:excisionase family DNA binding protein
VSSSPAIAYAIVEALDDDALEILAAKLAPILAQRRPPAAMDDRWIDTKQAARYLGITTSSLWKLTAARRVPFAQDKPGAKCWFQKAALDGWRMGA